MSIAHISQPIVYWTKKHIHPDAVILLFNHRLSNQLNKLHENIRAPYQYKDRRSRYGIPMLKIRRSQDRLIFNMCILKLVRRHLYTEPSPRKLFYNQTFMEIRYGIRYYTHTLDTTPHHRSNINWSMCLSCGIAQIFNQCSMLICMPQLYLPNFFSISLSVEVQCDAKCIFINRKKRLDINGKFRWKENRLDINHFKLYILISQIIITGQIHI